VSKNRVLVVEDEMLIRWDLVERLQDAGYATVEAGSAAEAIEILERDREIAVVFTDVQMPGSMDGIGLARWIRERWPLTIIIVSTGKNPSEMNELPTGCELFRKPFDWGKWADLLGGIQLMLGKT
jgi:two-component system, response regulator PdtaR